MARLRVPVSAADHSRGPEAARVTLVEYGDYQCPYCKEAETAVAEVVAAYGDSLRLIFRNFPLVEMHPEAMNAAYVAEFAAERGKFWQAHDLLYANQDVLGSGLYERICENLGLSLDELGDALEQRRYDERISADEEGGIRSGVNGTPTFFVNGERVDGGVVALESAVFAASRDSVG